MLEPKKIKYRRHHRGNRRGMASRGSHVAFGTYGLKALEPGWISARQIEASRIVISRIVRKVGKMWIRIFPDKPITCLLYTSPSPRDVEESRMPSSA